MQPIDFLRLVWGDRTGHVFLPYKRKQWVESEAFEWPKDEDKIREHIESKSKKADVYYSPNLFTQPSRRREYVQNPSWLYADLDAVSPNKLSITPHLAVQSSPGRFQGLWRLARPITPEKHEQYNQRLTYAVGADRGGWDLTQVLRIPGTRNHKYPGRVKVRLAWSESGKANLRQIKSYLDGVEANVESLGSVVPPDLRLPSDSADEIRERIGPALDKRTTELLDQEEEPPIGERSDRLWELECRLLEIGLRPEEVFVVVKDSVWNKHIQRRDGDLQLWREVQKAHLHVGVVVTPSLESANNGPSRARPRLLTYADLMGSAIREPDWAIEEWWTLGSHGILAGLPKSFKSLVSTDMAVALASETPFLGQFEVNPRAVGPVLMVQQENSLALVRDRLLKISHSRGLQTGSATVGKEVLEFRPPPSIPVLFYNDFGFDMTDSEDRESIEQVIRTEGIKSIFFDPLYLMIGGADENVAKEMRPVLTWLLRIRNLYNCQVVVIHHWGKGQSDKTGRGVGGTKLLGSTTIYGWLEAALYLEARHHDEGVQVVVEREFRERPSAPPMAFTLAMGDIGELGYEWGTQAVVGTTNKLIQIIDQAGAKGATMAFIRSEMNWGDKKARKELGELLDTGIVYTEKDGRTNKFYLKPGYEE